MLYQLSYFRKLFFLFQYFKEQPELLFPFCECKGTAFLRTTKHFLKKNAKKLKISSFSGKKALFRGKIRGKRARFRAP